MYVDITSIDWMKMLKAMDSYGIKTCYEVLDHCHASEFFKCRDAGEYGVTIECCSGTYEKVIEPTFADGIRRALKEQFKAKHITMRVIDLDRAFFYDDWQ